MNPPTIIYGVCFPAIVLGSQSKDLFICDTCLVENHSFDFLSRIGAKPLSDALRALENHCYTCGEACGIETCKKQLAACLYKPSAKGAA